ncbi:MAG: circularly permuted type 2 ATP-grasp protein [Cyclobacteriaceae bacterium]|nr:circularly permuted type 2 ATP-grasp protein [Cyclobacteriaceae bacterium]
MTQAFIEMMRERPHAQNYHLLSDPEKYACKPRLAESRKITIGDRVRPGTTQIKPIPFDVRLALVVHGVYTASVTGGDLTVSDGYVWLKTIKGSEKVDVIVRQVDDVLL